MITAAEFVYTDSFPTMSPEQIQAACDFIDAQWTGVPSLWKSLNDTDRQKKIVAVQNLLVGWHLANLYPASVVGVMVTGGFPLTEKSIGGKSGVSLKMKSLEEQVGMSQLTSNTFGIMALQMLGSAMERFAIYG